jgi:hypothetical protein
MNKRLIKSILDGLTHSGPSYHQTPSTEFPQRSTTFTDALLHRGPSYELGFTPKITKEAGEKILHDEIVPLLSSVKPRMAEVKRNICSLGPNPSIDQLQEMFHANQDLIRWVIESFEIDFMEISARMRRSLSPFDFHNLNEIRKQRRYALHLTRELRELHAATSELIISLQLQIQRGNSNASAITVQPIVKAWLGAVANTDAATSSLTAV